ncbi:MAG: AAA family ATPase [Cyanobacteria bacterium HKST-UBA05]|nr:AAA family ATPase [Cyanobacteria bacterium HKST-UBA05]
MLPPPPTRLSSTLQTQPARCTYDGILVVGTHAGCGKTVVTAALAVILNHMGFDVLAYKPLGLETARTRSNDQTYLDITTGRPPGYTTQFFDSPSQVRDQQWQRLMHQCCSGTKPFLIECPGSVTTPWLWRLPNILVDAMSVAVDYQFPTVLVAACGPDFIDQTHLALSHMVQRGSKPLGVVVTHPYPPGQTTDEALQLTLCQLLCQNYDVPYLGSIPYHDGVDVDRLSPGASVDLAAEHLDLLPFQLQSGVMLSC